MASGCDQGAVWIAAPLIGHDEETLRRIWQFTHTVGGHGLSPLLVELREKRGLVYDAQTTFDELGPLPVMHLHLMGEAAKVGESVDVALETLRGAAERRPEDVVAIGQARARTMQRMGLDDPAARAHDIVSDIVEIGGLRDMAARDAAYMVMTAEDVEEGGRARLATAPSIAIQGPPRQMPKASAVRAAWSGVAEAKWPVRRSLFRLAG